MVELIIGLVNLYVNMFNKLEEVLYHSRNRFIKQYYLKIVDFASITFILYLLTGLVYLVITFIPIINGILQNIISLASINNNPVNSIMFEVSPFPKVNLGLMMKLFLLNTVIAITVIKLNKNGRRVKQELVIIESILRLVVSNLNFSKKNIYIYITFIIATLLITYFVVPSEFYLDSLLTIFIFWTSIFIVIVLFSNLNKNKIQAKRLLFYLLILPVTIIYVLNNSEEYFYHSVNLLFVIVTIFLAFDRVISLLVDYREKLFSGEDLLFVINGFTIEDYDILKNKLKIQGKKKIEEVDDPTLLGLLFINSSNENLELAKYYFELALKLDPDNNVSKVYLAITLLKSNSSYEYIEKASELLNSVEAEQKSNNYNQIIFRDLQVSLAEVEFLRRNPDYNRIIELLKKESWLSDSIIYMLGYSYYKEGKFIEAKKMLSKLINNTNEFKDVPNLLTAISLKIDEP
ncbi:hypothetical protein SAFG77S_06861 [Streptomyces afghaniensis]